MSQKKIYAYEPDELRPRHITLSELNTAKDIYCFSDGGLRPNRTPISDPCKTAGAVYLYDEKSPKRSNNGIEWEWQDSVNSDLFFSKVRDHISPDTTIVNASLETFGLSGLEDTSKYLTSIVSPSGKIYCIGSVGANGELKAAVININTGVGVNTNLGITGLPESTLWEGAALGPDGKIYCMPSNGTDEILIIDPLTDTAELKDFGLDSTSYPLFDGAILGPDNKIYGIPASSDKVLIIDVESQSAEITDFGLDLSATFKYIGAAIGLDNKIYCANNAPDATLVIDPSTNSAEIISVPTIRNVRAANTLNGNIIQPRLLGSSTAFTRITFDENHDPTVDSVAHTLPASTTPRFGPAILGPDGRVYVAPRNHAKVVVYDESIEELTDLDLDVSLSGNFKFSNIILYKNKIICIAHSAPHFLVLEFSAEFPDYIYLDRRFTKN